MIPRVSTSILIETDLGFREVRKDVPLSSRVKKPDSAAPSPDFFTLYNGDSRRLDELLAPYSSPRAPLLTSTITSPPYGALKDYGHRDQIGWAQPHEEYLVECRRIFRQIERHTRDDGSMWLIADTLRSAGDDVRRLEPLPFQLAEQATEVGWTLRDVIIWKKDKTLPWSGRGRLRNTFEYILFFVKTDRFKYHVDRLRDPVELEEWWVRYPERYNPEGKVPTNVWSIPIPVQGSWANTAIQHACPLPPDLVERLLLLSTDEGDVVLDPFAGSGVVVAEAERLKRRGLGVELVNKHVVAYHTVVKPEILQRRGKDELLERLEQGKKLQDEILKLRALKYPRVLLRELGRARPDLPTPSLAFAFSRTSDSSVLREPHKVIECDVSFVVDASDEDLDDLLRAFKELSTKRPASKFGIVGDLQVLRPAELTDLVQAHSQLHRYMEGRTWWAEAPVYLDELVFFACRPHFEKMCPIISDIFIQRKPEALRPEAKEQKEDRPRKGRSSQASDLSGQQAIF